MAWIEVPGVGAAGLVKDQAPHELAPAVLTEASNVRLDADGVTRVSGTTGIGPTGAVEPHYLLPYTIPSTGARRVLQAGLATIYSNDLNATLTNVTRSVGGAYTGTATDRWTGGVLHGLALLNNGVDVPQFWNGVAATFADLTAWPAGWTAASLRPFRNFILALGMTKSGARYPQLVNWSHSADAGALPSSWNVADATKDAGEFPLSDTQGEIVDGLAAGEVFYVYKTDAIYRCEYIGAPFIFRFTKLTDTYGVHARNCIVNTPAGQVAMTAGDIVVNDGSGVRSIATMTIRRWLFAQIDATNRALCFLAANPKRAEVLVCYPEAGQSVPNMAAVWNWESGLWSMRAIGSKRHAASGLIPAGASAAWSAASGTWGDQAGKWGSSDFGDTDPRLLFSGEQLTVADQGTTLSGTAIAAKIERTGLAFGKADRVKVLRAVRPRIEAPTGSTFTVRFGGQTDGSAGVTWSAPVTYTAGQGDGVVHSFATGRLLGWRIESNGGAPWRLRSMAFDVVARGEA